METHGQAANTLQNTKQYPRVGQNWSYNAWSAPISITRRYFDLMKGWYDGTTGVTTHYTQVE